jgi:hypothetical protein
MTARCRYKLFEKNWEYNIFGGSHLLRIRYPLRGYDYGMGASLAGTQARERLKRGGFRSLRRATKGLCPKVLAAPNLGNPASF